MGSCNSREDLVKNTMPKKSTTKSIKQGPVITESNLLVEEEKLDPKFRNMPEWEGDRFRGEGVKKMKGYKCTLKIDQLNQLREDFWNIKIKEKLIWRNLKQACLMDDGNFIFINYSQS